MLKKSQLHLSKLAVTGLLMCFSSDNMKGPLLRCAMKEGTDHYCLLIPQKTHLPLQCLVLLRPLPCRVQENSKGKEASKLVSFGSCPHALIKLPNYKIPSCGFSSVLCHLITQLEHSWVFLSQGVCLLECPYSGFCNLKRSFRNPISFSYN